MKTTLVRHAVVAVTACVAITQFAVPATATTGHASAATSGNLIRNGGAEHTKPAPTTYGNKVAVAHWSVAKKYKFTAVRYGSPDFLTKHSAGPDARGKNFFAGGSTGKDSLGHQTDSLAPYVSWIKAGKGHFRLSGWLGGYSTQRDRASLTVAWQTASGKSLAHATIGPVTEAQRGGHSKLLYRSKSGTVPKAARQVRVTLHMVRSDGTYNDGYADNLRLTITKA